MTTQGEFYQRDRSLPPPVPTADYRTCAARSPRYSLISRQNSVSEITGPVFGHHDIDVGGQNLLIIYAQPGQSPIDERIILHGRVPDENASPVPNTLVEVWQANSDGRHARSEGGGEVEANAADPVLNLIELEHRRTTLRATRIEKDRTPIDRFDIKLQGEDETVFFDL